MPSFKELITSWFKSKPGPYAQDELPFSTIIDNVVVLKEGGYAVVIGLGGINLGLMSAGDKLGVHRRLSVLFNSLVGRKFQFLALVRSRDVSPLLSDLARFRAAGAPRPLIEQSFQEEDFLQELAQEGGIISRRYYMAIRLEETEFLADEDRPSLWSDLKTAFGRPPTAASSPSDPLAGGLPPLVRNRAEVLTTAALENLRAAGFNPYRPDPAEMTELCRYLLSGVGYGETILDRCTAPTWETKERYLKLGPDRYVAGLYNTSMPMRVTLGWLDALVKLPEQMVISLHFELLAPGVVERRLAGKAGLLEALELDQATNQAERHRLNFQKMSAHLMMEALAKQTEQIGFAGLRVLVQADTLPQLKARLDRVSQTMRQLRLEPATALLHQRHFLGSILPLAQDPIANDRSRRNMTTSAMVCCIPCVVMDLGYQRGSVLGVNAQDRSLVVVNRFQLPSYHKVIIAETGAGKTVSEFIETIRGLLQGYTYIWIDPQNTGMPQLMNLVGGEIIDLGPRGQAVLNPLDRQAVGGVENTLAEQIGYLTALLQLMARREFTALEESRLSQAIQDCYQTYPAPILSDLFDRFEAHGLARLRQELDRFIDPQVYGPLFNGQTNVALGNRCLSFNIRDLEERLLRPIRVFQAIHYSWSWIKASRWPPKVLVIDEIGLLLRFPDIAQYVRDLFKRGRAFGLSVVAIDQNPDNFLENEYGRQMLENAAIWQLMKLTPLAARKLAAHLDLTEGEYLTLLAAKPGEAILVIEGQKRVHLRFALSQAQLQALSTRPEAVAQRERGGDSGQEL